MNKTYKVVWNDALGLFQVVNELTRGRRKSAGHGDSAEAVQRAAPAIKLFRKGLLAAALSSLFLTAGPALAADLTITGLKIGSDPAAGVLTSNPLPTAVTDSVIVEAPTATTNNLFVQDQGIKYTVSNDLLTTPAGTFSLSPTSASISLGDAATGLYEFQLFGNAGEKLILKADLQKLTLVDGKTFELIRSDTDPDTFTALITGTGSLLTKGDMKLRGIDAAIASNQSDYKGVTTVESGTVTMLDAKAFGDTTELTVNAAGKVDMNSQTLTLSKLNGEGAVDVNHGELTIAEVVGTGAIDVNNGTLTLNLTNPDVMAKLTGAGGKVVIKLDDATKVVGFKHAGSDFAGSYEITNGLVDLDANAKTALGSAASVKLASADDNVESVKMTVNDAATLKNVSVDDATIVFAFGGKKLGETGAPMLNVASLTAEASSTVGAQIEVTQELGTGTVNWFDAEDKDEGQALIAGTIVNPDKIKISLNGTDVTDGMTSGLEYKNADGTKVADANYKLSITKTASEVGMKKTLKSLNLVDTTGEGLLIKPSATPENDAAITLSTQLTGNGNVTFDANGKTIIVNSANPETHPNDYEGKTVVRNGEVKANVAKAFGNTSELNVEGNGSVIMNAALELKALVTAAGSTVNVQNNPLSIGGGASTVAGSIKGAGNLDFTAGAAEISSSNNSEFEGETTISGGSLKLSGSNSLGRTKGLDVKAGTLTVSGDQNINAPLAVAAAGKVELEDGKTLTLINSASSIEGGLSGKGGLWINGGRLDVAGSHAAFEGTTTLSNNAFVAISDEAGLGAENARYFFADDTGIVTLNKNGAADLKAKLEGAGKVEVDLGGATNKLSLSNTGNENNFTGELKLKNAGFNLEGNNANSLAKAGLVVDEGSKVDVVVGEKKIGKLSLQGGELVLEKLTLGDPSNSSLITADAVVVANDKPTTVTISGVEGGSTMTGNVLDADDAGVTDTLIKSSSVTGTIDNLKLPGLPLTMTQTLAEAKATWALSDKLMGTADGVVLSRRLTDIELTGTSADGFVIDSTGAQNTTLSAKLTGSGNVTFTGDQAIAVSNAGNDYSGKTTVKTAVATGDNAFGHTSQLTVTAAGSVAMDGNIEAGALVTEDGAKLDLKGKMLVIGAVHPSTIAGDDVLQGAGTLKLNGSTMTVSGANEHLTAAVNMNNATVKLENTRAFGQAGLTSVGGISDLILAADGKYRNDLSGSFNLIVGDASTVQAELTGNNSISGSLTFKNDSRLTVDDPDSRIGNLNVDTSNGTLAVAVSQPTDLVFKNNLTGNGTVEVNTLGRSIELTDAAAFKGTLKLAKTSIDGSKHVNVIDEADLKLGDGSVLTVRSGGQQIKSLTVDGTSTLAFTDAFAPGSKYGGKLDSQNGIALADGATVVADRASVESTRSTAGDNRNLLDQDEGVYAVTLATGNATIATAGNVTLKDKVGNVISNAVETVVQSNGVDVADAVYDYSVNGGADGLKVGYQLKKVGIREGKSLILDTTGATDHVFSAELAGKGGLAVKGGKVTLSHADNSFEGETSVVEGSLEAAAANALGRTGKITVGAGQTLTISANQDYVGQLVAVGNVALTGTSVLTLNNADSSIETAAGLTGASGTKIVVNGGTLTINGAKTYQGDAHLTNGAKATLDNVAGLGNNAGSTVTLDDGTALSITHAGAADIKSKLEGVGLLNVKLGASTDALTFSNSDDAFAGQLTLETGKLTLAGQSSTDTTTKTLENAVLATGADADVTVSGGVNHLKGLTLGGGAIRFGEIALNGGESAGYVDLQEKDNLSIVKDTKIDLSLGTIASISSEGSELLSIDDGAQVKLVKNSKETIKDVKHLKFAGTQDEQSTELKQNGTAVADAAWALDRKSDNTFFATVNEGRDLVVNYKLKELSLKHKIDGEGLVVSTTNPDGEALSAKLTGDGNIVFNGGKITVDHENDYTGKTYVKAGEVIAGANNALGQTEELNISSGASFNLDSRSQTVGDLITASGSALKSNGGSLRLTGADSSVTGANNGLNARIALANNSKTTLDNVMGLGTGAIAIGTGDDVLTLSNASGKFANTLTGNGGLTLDNGSNVELTGANAAYEGKVTAKAGTQLTVNGPVADHLGKGQLHVDGDANLTQSGDWTLNNKLTGSGQVTVSADKAGGDGTFALGKGAESEFAGNLVLTEANMTLSDVANSEGKINADALAHAKLTIGTNGVVNVEKGKAVTGSLTMDGGTLVFAGSATPGKHQEGTDKAEAHLTVTNLTLNSGKVQVDVSQNVDPYYSTTNDSLTMQDVLNTAKVTTKLATATGLISSGLGSVTLVDKDGNDIKSDRRLNIQDEGGNVVADGGYGLGLAVEGKDLGLAYQLTDVNIHDGKILTLKGTPLTDNKLDAKLSGLGGLKIAEGEITLAHYINTYKGKTEVAEGATLVSGNHGSLGDTSGLDNKGTVTSTFNETIKGSVDNEGTLEINRGQWVVMGSMDQKGILSVENNGLLVVHDQDKAGTNLSGTTNVSNAELRIHGHAIVTGRANLENANVTFGNGGSAAEGTLVGTTGNKLNFNGGEFRMLGANAGLTAASTVASGAVLTLEKSADAVGKNGSVDIAGQLNLKGANGDFSNALSGNGKVDFVGTNAAFTADNSAFKGTITLDDASNLKVTAVNQLGNAAATIAGSGLVTMRSDAALNVNQKFMGSVNIDKLGTGDLVMDEQSLGSKGLIRMKGGVLRFGTPVAGATAAGSVELNDGTGMSAFGMIAGDLTVNGGATANVSGDANVAVTAPMLFKVGGRTVNNGTLQIGHLDGPAAATIGSRFEANDYVSGNGTIVVNALLNGDADSKLDTFKANGAASGTGKLTVNTVDEAGLGVTRNVNGVTVAEFESGTVDLSLTHEIKVNGLYYRLMKTDDGSRYYLSNQIQSAGTEAMTTSSLMQPEAGARAALAYAADQAFNISLHDHVGETLYIDQLTGEERLTSVWMAQTGDWTRWRDGTGQLYNKGQALTTHIGGDLITWGPADKHRLSFGLLGGYSYADFDSTSDLTGWNAKGTFNGYSVGAYLAWQNVAEDGPFGSVQLRWNSFRNSVQGDGYEKEKYTSDGISAALEAGWNQQLLHMKLENGTSALWRVQPHVGVYWSNISADDQTDANGQRFETDGDNNVSLRLGARTSITFAETLVPGVVDPGLTFYVEGNWIRNTGNYKATVFNQNGESTADLTADNLGEVRFGVEGHVNRNIQLWGDLHHRVGEQSYRSTGVMLGGKYVW